MTQSRFESDPASSRSLPSDYQLWYNLGTASPPFSMWSAARTHAWMGRIAYAYLSRYSVTLTGRQDCSNVVLGKRCGESGSAGVAWQLGDEPFMRIVPFLSGLKLRTSYGSTETASLDAVQANILLSPLQGWEKTKQFDVGLNVGLFRNRISGTFDVYREETHSPLPGRTLPSSSGFPLTPESVGRNAGWELSVSTVNLTGAHGGPRWTTDVSLAHNQNYITSLPYGGSDDVGDRWFVGQPINVANDALHRVFYDLKFVGIWQLADSLLAKQYGEKPGNIRVADLNGDGKIDGFDRVITGNTHPRLIASVYNRITWGAFDMSPPPGQGSWPHGCA